MKDGRAIWHGTLIAGETYVRQHHGRILSPRRATISLGFGVNVDGPAAGLSHAEGTFARVPTPLSFTSSNSALSADDARLE
jgi:hypothetical protein